VVFEHNLSDITSLARMYAAIARLLDGDLDAVPVDERALGRWMLSRKAHSGVALLAGSFSRGNLGAGVELSLHHKRQGEWEKALEIWQAMVEGGQSVFAAIELAKHLEHRAHDARRALAVVERLLSWNLPASAKLRGDIRLRRERLLRKSSPRRMSAAHRGRTPPKARA